MSVELYTEEQLAEIEMRLAQSLPKSHEILDTDEHMTDAVTDAETDAVTEGLFTPEKQSKGKEKATVSPAAMRASRPVCPGNMPAVIAKQVALAMVGGNEAEVTPDVLAYVNGLSVQQASEWLLEFKAVSKPASVSAPLHVGSDVLADQIRRQSMAANVQRPPWFTGTQQWDVWLASLMPWLHLQAVQSDAECVSMTLSCVKGDALTHWKNSDLGKRYYQHMAAGTAGDCDITWDDFSEVMAATPTDVYYTPLSIRSQLDSLTAGTNFRVFQAKFDSLLAKSSDMDENTKVYFYLKSIPDQYKTLFSMDNVHNSEWKRYADLKKALCKKVQLDGWESDAKAVHKPSAAGGANPYLVKASNPALHKARGGYSGGARGGYSGGYSGGYRGGYNTSARPNPNPYRPPAKTDRGGRFDRGGRADRGGRFERGGRTVSAAGRTGGRFHPYKRDEYVPRKYRSVAVVNAVASGTLTTDNVPESMHVDQVIAHKLQAPLPLVDAIGGAITTASKLADYENGTCFYCHKLGHTHDDCNEWWEMMTKEAYLNVE